MFCWVCMTGQSCESEEAALVWCCWTECFSVFCALRFSPLQKGPHYPFSDVSYLPLHLFFCLLFCILQPLAPSYPQHPPPLLFLLFSIPTVCSLGCSDRCISFYTNLSALTVAVATHHCHGNPDGLGGGVNGGGRAGQNAKKYERERQAENGESHQSFLIKR